MMAPGDNLKRKPIRAGRLHRCWLSFSLKKKIHFITGTVTAVVLLSVTASLLVSGFGMMEFGSILKTTSGSLEFWSAMEAESRIFANYMRDSSVENEAAYAAACERTQKALKELPFDYGRMGPERYAKTWSIRNSYEAYAKDRDQLAGGAVKKEYSVEQLYRVYDMQEYIKTYAGMLEQMNAESGNQTYQSRLPYFLVVPALVVLLGGISAAVMIWMQRSMSRDFIRPVLEMAEDSRRIAANDFSSPDLMADREDEIGELIRAFCKMKKATQGYIVTLKEKHAMERQLDDVRLQMLKNQINPHFLFNTLNMIASMAEIEEARTTEKMITAMSSLFRYNLKSTDSVMPLERELKIVKDYLFLQQMRFGSRLHFHTDCKPETLGVLVPSFALQPLVENAIVHGITGKETGGTIYIRSWFVGKRLWISVADTGMGMEEEELRTVYGDLKRGGGKKVGVGVGNIYHRIRTMYEDGEMHLYSKKGCGTVVQLAFTEGGSDHVSDIGSGG